MDGSITSSVVRVGLGADLYGFVGKFVPRSLVGWMMGIRRVDELSAWQPSHLPSSRPGSDQGDMPGSDYVAVHPGHPDADVWKEQ